ncbi:hypothetical protein QQS21_001539 [Conoideocrella luteorostrata]|uniref:Uncharacterized protein n=1 Tax=Conoideocrella luteorostrata TaxID=1105319 RepID=A0AAJ0G1T6_9HYPO|nr:hypothetical protein QQS21_001539 [Conoideocrella luteorostrata]
MSSSAALSADASRQRSRILTPSSDGSLNRRGASLSPDGRISKRADAVAMDHLLKPSIVVKPHPPNLHVQPRALLPLMLLPREHLPLASFDLSPPDIGFPQTRFVESYVKILDLESRLGSAPAVVIARNDSKGTIYALERQANGLYVMCKLGSWVDLGDLAKHATALSHDRLASQKPALHEQDVTAASTSHQQRKEQKNKRAAIEAIQNLVRKKPKSQPVSEVEEDNKSSDGPNMDSLASQLPSPEIKMDEFSTIDSKSQPETAPITDVTEDKPPDSSQQTAEMIFDAIRSQYFEALYRSMVCRSPTPHPTTLLLGRAWT